jgi:hypothetical protein
MAGDASYRVEEFLEAITSQLDRTQDALRLKAVNRPLTYAIRDFSLDMHVFVELDHEGRVRFRNSGPNESGASTVTIGFTTITRPMIEENTIGLSEVQGPSLDDLGLDQGEQRQLEKLGVRNAAQLKRLNSSSGEGAVARFSNVPVNRLRAALQASRPQVDNVAPENGTHNGADRREADVRVPKGSRRLRLEGANLRELRNHGTASLQGVAVPIVSSADDHLVIDLGNLEARGRLEIDTGDGDVLAFQLNGDVDETRVLGREELGPPGDIDLPCAPFVRTGRRTGVDVRRTRGGTGAVAHLPDPGRRDRATRPNREPVARASYRAVRSGGVLRDRAGDGVVSGSSGASRPRRDRSAAPFRACC